MQRFLTFLLMFFAVTLAACASAPERPVSVESRPLANARPIPQAEVTLSPLARVAPPAATAVDTPLQPLGAAAPATAKNAHIALLLPLNSPAFGRAAEAVKQGFMAATSVQAGDLPIRVYPSGDQPDDIVAAYSRATQAGARIVVGPLTKNGVSALAASNQVSVPTLALNQPESLSDIPPQLYVLALAADIEARQIAQAAFGEGRKTAVIVASGNSLAKRMQLAFADEWTQLGGELVSQLNFSGSNPDAVRDALQRHPADMLFLAMDGGEARQLRPYLSSDQPIYATSQIYAGKNNPEKYYDLNGIHFIDMPWLLQPDHLAVMVYPRPQAQFSADLERLYALGIDAWRLALLLQAAPTSTPLTLDGVTGRLSLDKGHQIERAGVLAVFRDGDAAPLTP
ncbi:penicillin-binding protein activator [Sulfurimicrobium lacus]|nr:penicillin-binding protein activator [Sulfurimicrobium lacus]